MGATSFVNVTSPGVTAGAVCPEAVCTATLPAKMITVRANKIAFMPVSPLGIIRIKVLQGHLIYPGSPQSRINGGSGRQEAQKAQERRFLVPFVLLVLGLSGMLRNNPAPAIDP